MLYRFFSDNQYSLSSLANHYLWFSNLEDFNDPFETHINSTLYYENIDEVDESTAVKILKSTNCESANSISYEQYLLELALMQPERFKRLKKKTLAFLRNKHKETYTKYSHQKWCCFTVYDKEFGEPIERRLMWGHYANGLRGFAVEFEDHRLINSIKELNREDYVIDAKTKYGELSRVGFYSEFLLEVKPSDEKLANFLHQKSNEWSYESERRLGIKKQRGRYNPDAVKRIIIGEKMPTEYRETLFLIIHSALPKVDVYEAYIDPESLVIQTRQLTQ
ncbi:DUF2971 domain-containing protein [Agarivorans sp. JK6]|uniref:DUF2971 domain-containing protein n=1 Tax=Agarivorans sp. JK6 TaxID=2997426 RepID=UPI0038735EAC